MTAPRSLLTLFDSRFDAAAASVYAFRPVRVGIAMVLVPLMAMAISVTGALWWMLAAAIAEIGLISTTGPAARGEALSQRRRRACFVVYALAVPTWTGAGAMLWASDNTACQVAGAGFFAAHLLYIQALHARSLGALIPTTPSIFAPALAPLLVQQYSGWDQLYVMLTFGTIVGHALFGFYVTLKTAATLDEAQTETLAASRAKSDFLAKMSHEIRTPLNGVLGMTQSLLQDGRLEAGQREKLAVVEQSGGALLALLNDLLDISKIEAGKLELEVRAFDLAAALKSVVSTFSAVAADKGIGLRLEIDPEAQGAYDGDALRVRQIVTNLVSNAVKFTESGEVAVRAGASPDGRVRISVSDTGIGIDDETLGRLFAKFEQADSSTTRRYGGSGLGLAICREIAELMGGHIDVESAPGRGATFTVTLPLKPRRAPAPSARAEAEGGAERPVLTGLRVLAADDNATNRLVLKALLAPMDVDLTLVENGREALGAWQAEPWDLILMDVQMPEMDGVEATAAIRAAEQASGRPRTPIIALTANAMTHQVAHYLARGMDGHVAKPIDATSLYTAIAGGLAAREANEAATG
ncbi:ATP-binding protein [Phenylobacterium sp.]|jgi:signal transduction histidine kinase/CheY-like chemotaxis protein|uniref:ATP-binding protein n=1 Tax=Phenylobacterium sp. TaxID=1871053 RepID=UPI002E35F5F3|nr:ATP-binding protein [Phenylobacterium sp.]HEX2559115.1 ATP-binding protein [Phenylobacterium sp.]